MKAYVVLDNGFPMSVERRALFAYLRATTLEESEDKKNVFWHEADAHAEAKARAQALIKRMSDARWHDLTDGERQFVVVEVEMAHNARRLTTWEAEVKVELREKLP